MSKRLDKKMRISFVPGDLLRERCRWCFYAILLYSIFDALSSLKNEIEEEWFEQFQFSFKKMYYV